MASEEPRTADEFTSFFRARYNPTVRRLMSRQRWLPQADAEDIVSAAFYEASRKWKGIENPEAWLWVRVCKRFFDYLRKKQALNECPGDLLETVIGPSDTENGKWEERCLDLLRLNRLISKLPTEDQRLITMYRLGATGKEQAAALKTTEGAVRVRLHRAKNLLKTMADQEAEVR
ncbi:RNA polymerase sigma factor [Streptomyces sp. NPDC054871]